MLELMKRKPQTRGRWLLNWDSQTIQYPAIVEASGWYLDLRRMSSAMDVLDVLSKAHDARFVTRRDLGDLVDLLRVFVRGRYF